MKVISNPRRISLWLLPPEPLRASLSAIQSDIISKHPTLSLPSFVPHVTLVGGIPISQCSLGEDTKNSTDEEHAAQVVLGRLQQAFHLHGGVACSFVKERGVFAARNSQGAVQWNQSCVSILERNESLLNAMRIADKAIVANAEALSLDRYFKPPLREPHYSFVYGNDPALIPKTLECPPSFTSTEMVLMWTSPPTLEGVAEWEEIGRINLI